MCMRHMSLAERRGRRYGGRHERGETQLTPRCSVELYEPQPHDAAAYKAFLRKAYARAAEIAAKQLVDHLSRG